MTSVESVFPSPHTHSPQQLQQQHQHAHQPAAATLAVTERVEDGREAEGGKEGGMQGSLKDAVGGSTEAEGGDPFMAIDKEVIDLFKDGDVDSW